MEDEKKQSEKILKRVADESEVVGTSSFARTANRARDHFSGSDGDQTDRVEIWALRFARILSLIVFVVLAVWLFNYLGRPK